MDSQCQERDRVEEREKKRLYWVTKISVPINIIIINRTLVSGERGGEEREKRENATPSLGKKTGREN